LEIPQTARDSHFPTAATTTSFRLHFKCLDKKGFGYILRWLDRPPRRPGVAKFEDSRAWNEKGRGEEQFDMPLDNSRDNKYHRVACH
jgi:hypothetical protein